MKNTVSEALGWSSSVCEERQRRLGTELGEEVMGRGVERVKLLAVGCVLRGSLQVCVEQRSVLKKIPSLLAVSINHPTTQGL